MNTIQKSTVPYQSISNQLLIGVTIFMLSGIWLVNFLSALIRRQSVLISKNYVTVYGDTIVLRVFQFGLWKESFLLWEVMQGNVCLVGSPLNASLKLNCGKHVEPGLVSLWQLHQMTGLSEIEAEESLQNQLNMSRYEKIRLVVKFLIVRSLYQNEALNAASDFDLFGVRIDNLTMADAVSSVTECMAGERAKLAFFVNVNSFNIACSGPQFKHVINSADYVFADGSGVRLGAKYRGVKLQGNVNGTDMLPLLCKSAQKKGLSMYLLGGAEGVARITSDNLKKQYKDLNICGTHSGYFDRRNSSELIDRINASGADILLVGMGSPVQENWLLENVELLNCRVALAVGGLFDFYSGRIPRAPLWMREMGLEWIWRLMQEPKAKFHRYVIGNPLFLFRLVTSY